MAINYDELGNVINGSFDYTPSAGGGRGFVNPPNAYQHTENNVVVSSDDIGKLNLKFQPNILDNYDVVTYHWKLFIVPTEVTSSGNVLNLKDQTIIAESGVSDLTIDKVELRSITTPSMESGTGTMTHAKFEIVEPSGAGLIDKIFYQSVALGIGNWHVMPIYLQLEFRARSPDTSESFGTAPGALGSLKWVWPLKIGDIKANVTTVGTRYDFTTILYDQLAQSNLYSSLRHNAVLTELDTFGKAMTQLADKFNSDQLLSLVGNASIPDVYRIVVDPDIAGYKITPTDNNKNSSRNGDFVKFDEKTASFTTGTSIDKIIDCLLSNTKEFQEGVTGAPVAGAPGAPMQSEPSQMKNFWRIVTESRPLQFDPRRQNNANEFTIFVVKYDLGVLDANASQTSNPPATVEASKKRLATYIKKNILKKKYNYIFTGLNDQIINFDLNLNCAFAAATARLDGVYSNSAMGDKGAVTQNNSSEERAVTEKLVNAMSFQNNSKTATSAGASAAMDDAKKAIASSTLPTDTKSRYLKLLEKSKPENRAAYLKEVSAAGGIDNNGDLTKARAVAVNIAKPADKFEGRFISDVDVGSRLTKDAYQSFLNSTHGKLRPTAFFESMQDKSVGLGIESNSNSGIQKLASMFSTALHSDIDGSMQQIKMTIKGDPFWLFPQPIVGTQQQMFNSLRTEADAIKNIKTGYFNMYDSVNIYGSDNFIVVRFRTPRIFNTDANTEDGSSAYNEVEAFSGVYKVISVASRFDGGKFVQDIVCMIDPEIRLLDFMKEIEAEAHTPETPAVVSDLINRSHAIPATAIKTEKIMGSIDASQATTQFANLAGSAKAAIKSNTPTAIASIIHGLPNNFG